jgi:hypothetical protein
MHQNFAQIRTSRNQKGKTIKGKTIRRYSGIVLTRKKSGQND